MLLCLRNAFSRNKMAVGGQPTFTHRLKSYKGLFPTQEESRKHRSEEDLELRKRKREEQFSKRRNIGQPEVDAKSGVVIDEGNKTENGENTNAIIDGGTPLSEVINHLYSTDNNTKLAAVCSIRKALSKAQNPPIDEVLDLGVLPTIVQMLQPGTDPKIQFEACWVITNVCSGTSEQTHKAVEYGCVQALIALIASDALHIQEQAVWALGNILGDGVELRDFCFKNNIVQGFLEVLDSPQHPSLQLRKNLAWAISNLCRHKNPPSDLQKLHPLFNHMKTFLFDENMEVLVDTLWAWSYLCDGANNRIEVVIEAGICPRLVEVLLNPEKKAILPALRTLGNIVTGSDDQTEHVLECNVLEPIKNLMLHDNATIKKESCWLLSNIAAGNQQQIQQLLDHDLFPRAVQIFKNSEFKIKKEICWMVGNITNGGSPQQVRSVMEFGFIPPLCDMLSSDDGQVLTVILEGFQQILRFGQVDVGKGGTNPYALEIEEAGGLDALEKLQHHPNGDIYQQAFKIIDDFFQEEEVEDRSDD